MVTADGAVYLRNAIAVTVTFRLSPGLGFVTRFRFDCCHLVVCIVHSSALQVAYEFFEVSVVSVLLE